MDHRKGTVMLNFVSEYDKFIAGTQKVTQRLQKCTCGCQGQDPWHTLFAKRVVKDIILLDQPHQAKRGYPPEINVTICATGTYKHPSGIRVCGLVITPHLSKWLATGWHWLDDKTPIEPAPTNDTQSH